MLHPAGSFARLPQETHFYYSTLQSVVFKRHLPGFVLSPYGNNIQGLAACWASRGCSFTTFLIPCPPLSPVTFCTCRFLLLNPSGTDLGLSHRCPSSTAASSTAQLKLCPIRTHLEDSAHIYGRIRIHQGSQTRWPSEVPPTSQGSTILYLCP